MDRCLLGLLSSSAEGILPLRESWIKIIELAAVARSAQDSDPALSACRRSATRCRKSGAAQWMWCCS